MNIFSNLPNPQKEKWERHQKYLRDRGITESQFQQELEQKREQEHLELLKSLGVTEEVFQKKVKRKKRIESIKESLMSGLGCLILFMLYIGIPVMVCSDFGKPFLIILGIIWGLFLLGSILVPVVFFINEVIKDSMSNKAIRIVVAVLISILILGGLAYTCGSSNTEYHIDDAHRPDRF